jgi:microcystin-dependent protein
MDPFVAEIRIFPFNFAPKGWAFCDGQILPLSQNTALFSLLGTTYGGDGKSNFALPNMQGNVPMHPGQGPGLSLHDLGETGGSDTVTLLESEIPSHSHTMMSFPAPGNRTAPGGNSLARVSGTIGPYIDEHGGSSRHPRRRRSAPQQFAAVSDPQLLHRAAGCLPAAHLISANTFSPESRTDRRAAFSF